MDNFLGINSNSQDYLKLFGKAAMIVFCSVDALSQKFLGKPFWKLPKEYKEKIRDVVLLLILANGALLNK